MNSNRLSRLYDGLAPRQRVAAIHSAAVRGDEADRQRLIAASPMVRFDVPAYHGTSIALKNVANRYAILYIETLVLFWRAEAGHPEAWGDDEAERWAQLAKYSAYRLRVQREAWQQFCTELQIDPAAIVDCLTPLINGPDSAPSSEDSPEAIRELCPTLFTDSEEQPPTVESELEYLWVFFADEEKQWA